MKNLMLYIILVLLFISSCSKDPTANFEYQNSDSISTGEKVVFINTSNNAESYLWEFGDGHLSVSESPEHRYYSAGIYTISLTAYNENTSSTVTQKIDIKNAQGKVIFWSDFYGSPIEVIWEGTHAGIITKKINPNTPPNCGREYCVTINFLDTGSYSYTAKETANGANKTWSGTAHITVGTCLKIDLTSSKGGGKPIIKTERGVCCEENNDNNIEGKIE